MLYRRSVEPPHVQAIYHKLEMRWRVTRINVLIRIRRESLCRKELASKARARGPIDVEVPENIMLRHAGVLRDVAYAADISGVFGDKCLRPRQMSTRHSFAAVDIRTGRPHVVRVMHRAWQIS